MNQAGVGARLRAVHRRHERLRRDGRLRRRRDHGRPAALAGHEPRRPRHDERGDRRLGHEGGRQAVAEGRDRRRLEPARRDVPRREGRLEASRRSASSAWPASSTRRASPPSSRGRPARRSRTCRRWCSAGTATRWSRSSRRRPSAACRSSSSRRRAGSRRWSSARARAAASSSTCSARPPGTRPAQPRRRWSTRSASTRSACCRARRYLEGEYGVDGLYMGVPVELGAAGVEEIVKLKLTAAEKKMLQRLGRGRPRGRRRARTSERALQAAGCDRLLRGTS